MQRAYLEALAYRMQTAREHYELAVVIDRERLIDELVAISSERSGAATPEATRRLVERWIRFLEEGTGLLVEHRPGVFAFFHLSLMEYLAAKGMEKAEVLEEAIVERFGDSAWREACLLAVGSRATAGRPSPDESALTNRLAPSSAAPATRSGSIAAGRSSLASAATSRPMRCASPGPTA